MKIVHICPLYTDGWSYHDNLLPKYHRKIGHEVTIIAPNFEYDENAKVIHCSKSLYYNEDGVWIIRLETKKDKPFEYKFKNLVNLEVTLEKENPDILFVHGVQFVYIKTILKFVKRHKNVILYVDNHADFSNSATNWLSRNILHRIIWKHYAKMIEPYTRRFYGVLPSRVDWLVNMYGIPREKVKLLIMGADDDKVAEAQIPGVSDFIRKENNIEKDDFLIVSGGKIDLAKKQVLLLMDAVNSINSEKVRLIVFGPVVDELKEEVFRRCSDRVKYIPWLSDNESYKYFTACDFVVFPGRHSVYWEQAAGCGVPLMVRYWEGTAHVDVGGNCMFLYEDSSDEIKRNILSLTCDDNRYGKMKAVAIGCQGYFLYSDIAKLSLTE